MRNEARNSRDKTFTSARNLLGVLRLATALARLRLSDSVEKDDITEANRLIEQSKSSINDSGISSRHKGKDDTNKIYDIIKELAGEDRVAKVPDIMNRCTSKGFKPDQVNKAIEEYEELNVWQVNQARTKITLV